MTRSLRHRLLSLALCLIMIFQTTGLGALAASLEDTAVHAIGTPSDMEPPTLPEPDVPDDPAEPPTNDDEPEADGDMDAPEIGDSEPEIDVDEPATDDATGEPEAVFGDVNGDGQVNVDDLTLLLTHGYSLAEAQERMPLALSDRPVDISRFEASLWSDPEGTEKQLLSPAELAALAENGWQGPPAGELCDGALNYRRASFPELPGFEAQCLLYGDAYVIAVREVVIADAQEYLYIATLRYLIFNGQQVPVESFALLGPGARLQIRYIAVATEAPEEEPDEETAEPEALHIVLRFEFVPDNYSFAAIYAGAAPYAVLSDKAIRLVYGMNLTGVTMSYYENGNWVEITEDNAPNLQADGSYQFEYAYSELRVSDIKAADYQMFYDNLPEWFTPSGKGVLYYGAEQVGAVEAVDGKIVITFDRSWLDSQAETTRLSGTFKVNGSIDWHKLPQDGQAGSIDGLNFNLSFESDLAQKYGELHLEKTTPTLIERSGVYYLQYSVVINSKDSVVIPAVTVKDLFGNTAYIERYIGLNDGALPKEDPGNLFPWETSSAAEYVPGSLSGSAAEGMVWEIGDLQPDETRVLTYCAEISQSYVDSLTRNAITNNAEAYSGDYRKGQSSSDFSPAIDVSMSKTLNDDAWVINNDGNGYLSYTVTITVPEENSFVMKDMTFTDAFPADLSDYLSGEDGEITVTITVKRDGQTVEEKQQQVSYADASFTLEGLTLAPGTEITVTYLIYVKNVFLHNNGDVLLQNVASVGKDGGHLASATHQEKLHKSTWLRKAASEPLLAPTTVLMEDGEVYSSSGSGYVQDQNPGSFDVPAGSVRYQVALNENGLWDLSSTTMNDSFGENAHMQYVGYVRLDLFNRSPADNTREPSDEELIAELERLTPVQTVWIKVDGASQFTFQPQQLGLSEKHAYLLTYYAEPVNMGSIGQIVVSNSFELSGFVGSGSGPLVLPAMRVTVSKIMQGGANYNVSKTGWYYEPYSDLYFSDAMTSGAYKPADYQKDYANGALYWVIRLEGDVLHGQGVVQDVQGNPVTMSGFYLTDTPSTNQVFNRDALIGIYRGPKNYDVTKHASFQAFKDVLAADGFESLRGNPQNDRFFPATQPSNPEYTWYAANDTMNGICFPNDDGYPLTADQALYIVLRTKLSNPLGNKDVRTCTNSLSVASGGDPIYADSATQILSTKTSLNKESKGAYIFDKQTGEFVNCSDHNDRTDDWKVKQQIPADQLPSSGTYAIWLLNVNWNGGMIGQADVVDNLPPGMELVYVDVNNYGGNIKNSPDQWPVTVPIRTLGPGWQEMTQICTVSGNTVTTLTYYNQSTGEVRWRFTGLTQGNIFDKYQVNLRIVCKVTDPNLFLNGSASYTNSAAVLDDNGDPGDPDSASVLIQRPMDKAIDLATLKTMPGVVLEANGDIRWPLPNNRLPFTLNINPYGEDIADGDTLPPLIDELSATLELIEDSLVILAGDSAYTGYTYTVETKNGQQSLIIQGLPDNTPLTIQYAVRIVGVPNMDTSISNTAYWSGYDKPERGQVEYNNAKYQPTGDVFISTAIKVQITKVDEDMHAKRLSGAEFEIYECENGALKEPALMSGKTDSMGKLTFPQGDDLLMSDKVYCIREKTAPTGYGLKPIEGDNDYYFIIADSKISQIDISALRGLYPSLDVWYDSPEYSIVIENPKGTIGVNKVFVDQYGSAVTPTSGSYRFGLFSAGRCLEILTIQYAETQEQTTYLLDGYQRDTPTFTKYDPETVYNIYELDENDQPITTQSLVHLDNAYYRVSYLTEDITAGNSGQITNTLIAYDTPQSLTISKTTAGQGADTSEVFTFTIRIESLQDGEYPIVGVPTPANDTIAFKDGEATVTLAHGQSVTILCLPADLAYTVTETTNDDYDVVATGNKGTLASGEATQAAFVNYRVQPDIAKTVDDTDGIVDIGQELTYTITWSNSTASAAEVTITDELPEGLDFISASGEYTLSADRRTVTWALGMKEPYTSGSVTVTVQVNKLAWNTKITNEATITVGGDSHTPWHTAEVGEGSLTVRKTVLGEGAEADETLFDFTVTLDNQSISGDYGNLTFEDGVAHVKLSGGQSATASGLPSGTGYTVHEGAAEGYRTASSGTTGVITQNGSATAAFTNTILSRSLKAVKTLTNSGSGAQGAFRAGDTATFDIVVENTGEMTQANVTVTEGLKGATFKPGLGYTVSEDGTIATIAELTPGGRVTVHAEYRVTEADIANPATLENVAVIGGEGAIEQPDPAPIPKEAPDPTDAPTQSPTDAPAPTDTPRPTDEPTVTATSGPTVTPSGPTATPGPGQDSTPKTGDDSMLWLWGLILILSGAGMLVALLRLRPRKK